MPNGVLVYREHVLCALEWEAFKPMSEPNKPEPKPLLRLWWWPLAEPSSLYVINRWLGSWDKENVPQDDWILRPVQSTHTYKWWDPGHNQYFRIEERRNTKGEEKGWALVWARLEMPAPRVNRDVEMDWGWLPHGGEGWRKWTKSHGWRPIDYRFRPYRTHDGSVMGCFEQGKGEKWVQIGNAVDLGTVGEVVRLDPDNEVPRWRSQVLGI